MQKTGSESSTLLGLPVDNIHEGQAENQREVIHGEFRLDGRPKNRIIFGSIWGMITKLVVLMFCKLYTATMSQPDSLLTRATSHSTGHTVVTLNMNTLSGGLKTPLNLQLASLHKQPLQLYTVDI